MGTTCLRRWPAVVLVTAGALVLAWRLELWLLVMGIGAAAVVLTRPHLEERRRWLPALLTAHALAGLGTTTEEQSNEDVIVAGLAVLAKGRPGTLDRAIRLAHADADTRRWARAVGRLAVAAERVTRGELPGVRPRRLTSPWALAAWSGLCGLILLANAAATSRWWLVPLTVSFIGVALKWTDVQDERQWRPLLVAAEAGRDHPTSLLLRSDHLVGVELAVMTAGQHPSLARAVRLVEQSKGPAEAKARATLRLRMADTLLTQAERERQRQARHDGWRAGPPTSSTVGTGRDRVPWESDHRSTTWFAAMLRGGLPRRRRHPVELVYSSDRSTNLHEVTVAAQSPVVGRRAIDLTLPHGAMIVLVRRGDDVAVPKRSTILEPGDNVVLLADLSVIGQARRVIEGPQ